jgi:hypothetical protein
VRETRWLPGGDGCTLQHAGEAGFRCSFCMSCKLSRPTHIKIASLTILIRAAAMRCRKGGYMSRYKVMVDDNFHYMDEDERYELGTFSTIEEAVATCKQLIDDDLRESAKAKNYTPDELYDYYVSFGSDPFIVALDSQDGRPSFSAWNYAKGRSQVLAPHRAGQA